MSVGRIIACDADVAEGAAWLAARDTRFAKVLDLVGPPPLRRWDEGFATLLHVILGQQVSVASADATYARLELAGLTNPVGMAAASDAVLRGMGLSRQKARYAQALAQADIDYNALRDVPDANVFAALVAVPGIGAWTAEIYAMFALGRADVFAHGDLALQEAARGLLGLDKRPNEREMRVIAMDWAPWRAVAARVLWSYYRVMKTRDGIV